MKEELLLRFDYLTTNWKSKEAKLEAFIQKWLAGETVLSNEQVQKVVDKTTDQIEQLKILASEAMEEYNKQCKEEQLKEEGLSSAKRTVISTFGTDPDEMIITGGVLASNAKESHLIGHFKTDEEKKEERQSAFAEIRNRVATKKITLEQASALKNAVNVAYGYQEPIIKNSVHK